MAYKNILIETKIGLNLILYYFWNNTLKKIFKGNRCTDI